jgi:hypothetical protein
MPHRSVLPSYHKRKQSGQAIVTFRLPGSRRKDYLLGPHGLNESMAEYARLLAEFQAGQGAPDCPAGPAGGLTVIEGAGREVKKSNGPSMAGRPSASRWASRAAQIRHSPRARRAFCRPGTERPRRRPGCRTPGGLVVHCSSIVPAADTS